MINSKMMKISQRQMFLFLGNVGFTKIERENDDGRQGMNRPSSME